MLRIAIQDFVAVGENVLAGCMALDRENGVKPESVDEGLQCLYEGLSEMQLMCRLIGAHDCDDLLDHKVEYFDKGLRPRTWEEVNVLKDVFKKELEKRHFFYMPLGNAAYYENPELLSGSAKIAFPKLAQEMRSAGNAYACGLPTACVFHCMRALEHALAALASDVGLTWQKEQWHNIIEMIESRITDERKGPRSVVKDERLRFLSGAAKEFFYFKDGWRNHVSHNRVSYEAPQAADVLEHVCAFTEHLASKLRERI